MIAVPIEIDEKLRAPGVPAVRVCSIDSKTIKERMVASRLEPPASRTHVIIVAYLSHFRK